MQPLERMFNRLRQRYKREIETPRSRLPDVFNLIENADKKTVKEQFKEHKDHFITARDAQKSSILHAAIEHKRDDLLPFFLKHAPDLIEEKKTGNMTPLHVAVHTGASIDCVNMLIENGADIEHKGSEVKSLLHIAALENQAHLIPELVKHGLDIHDRDQRDATPLIYASKRDAVEAMQVLLSLNAEADVCEENGYSALHIALLHDNEEMIDVLLNEKSVVAFLNDDKTKREQYTPLMVAVTHTKFETAKRLIDLGANVNDCDIKNRTALSMVLHNPHQADIEPIIEYLIEHGADIPQNIRTEAPHGLISYQGNPEYILHDAIERGASKSVLKTLIHSGMDIDELNRANKSPINIAIETENVTALKVLLESGASLEAKHDWFADPISMIVEKEESQQGFRMLELLRTHGARINQKDDKNVTPLHRAVGAGREEYAHYLIENGANINVKANDVGTQDTPFMRACKRGQLDCAKLLHQHGANIHARDDDGNTVLHAIAANSNLDMLQYLTDIGMDIYAENKEKKTPLTQALSAYTSIDAALHLIKAAQHPINKQDHDGKTILHHLVQAGKKANIQQFLDSALATEIDINIRDKDGYTALMLATMNNKVDIMTTLLEKGAHINATDHHGRTPLYIAVTQNKHGAIDLLMKNDANLNIVPKGDRRTYLHHAAEGDMLDFAEKLIQAKQPVNKQDTEGNTPLHIAAKFNNVSMADYLLEEGADPKMENDVGYRAIDIAENKGLYPIKNRMQLYLDGTPPPPRGKYGSRNFW